MRSEIPQLEVVTAIGDADAEDYVSQLLSESPYQDTYSCSGANLREYLGDTHWHDKVQ